MCRQSRGCDKRGISRYQAQLVMCMHSTTAVCCQPPGVQSLWKGPRHHYSSSFWLLSDKYHCLSLKGSTVMSSPSHVFASFRHRLYPKTTHLHLFLHRLSPPIACSYCRACRRKTCVFVWLAGVPLCAPLPARRCSRCSWSIGGLQNSFCVCACRIYSTIKILMVESTRHTHIGVIKFVNIKIFWNPVRNVDLYAWHGGWFEDEMSCLLLHTCFNCSLCWCDMPTCLQASSNICVCVCERERQSMR